MIHIPYHFVAVQIWKSSHNENNTGSKLMVYSEDQKTAFSKSNNDVNIANGTTDPGVDYFDQQFWLGRFRLVGLDW